MKKEIPQPQRLKEQSAAEMMDFAVRTLKWVKEKDVSGITGLAVQTLRNKRNRGEGPPYSKIGRSVRYKVEDIISYMESNKVKPSGQE